MTNPVRHALNIGTLALWLSVAAFGAVAVWVPRFVPEIKLKDEDLQTVVAEDFTLGEVGESQASESSPEVAAAVETLPAPPEPPELAEMEPLPEIPNLPAPVERPSPAPSAPRATLRPASSPRPAAANPGKPTSATTGKPTGGMSTATRLAAGRMPAPSYPPFSRRNNQTGTVVVQFTVDESGRVISASVYKSSSWPLLDSEAVRTVRTWKFPPGDVMTNIKPIKFNLE